MKREGLVEKFIETALALPDAGDDMVLVRDNVSKLIDLVEQSQRVDYSKYRHCPDCGELLIHANIGDGTVDTYCEDCEWQPPTEDK